MSRSPKHRAKGQRTWGVKARNGQAEALWLQFIATQEETWDAIQRAYLTSSWRPGETSSAERALQQRGPMKQEQNPPCRPGGRLLPCLARAVGLLLLWKDVSSAQGHVGWGDCAETSQMLLKIHPSGPDAAISSKLG